MSNSATPWTEAHQASLSITNYLGLLKTNGKILKEMGIPDHLICLLRNLYVGLLLLLLPSCPSRVQLHVTP